MSTYSLVHGLQENTMSWLNAHFGARTLQGGMRPPGTGKFSGEVTCYGDVSNEPSISGQNVEANQLKATKTALEDPLILSD